MNAFLALSVDKLSEIRDLEEDESKEKESEEKERKEREEQLSALKNPKVEVRRRTIRRMLRLQASNPRERIRSSFEPVRNKWWKQISLPLFATDQQNFREIKRSTSAPESAAATPTTLSGEKLSVIEEEGSAEEVGGGASTPQKRRNPLSLVQNPSSYFHLETIPGTPEKKDPPRERTGLEHDNPIPTAYATRMVRTRRQKSPPTAIMEEGDSIFAHSQRQMSIVSSPPDPVMGSSRSWEREWEKRGKPHRAHSLPISGRGPMGDFGSKVNWNWDTRCSFNCHFF